MTDFPSDYPGAFDAFPTTHVDRVGEKISSDTLNGLSDAVNKLERELGTDPSGVRYSTVKARLDGHNVRAGGVPLAANAASVTLPVDFSDLPPLAQVLISARCHTGPNGTFDRVRLQFGAGGAAGDYAWYVENANDTRVGSDPAVGAPTNSVSSASILVSHATLDVAPAGLYAESVLTLMNPGATGRCKSLTMVWAFVDSFTGGGQGPLATYGMGIWKITNPITQLTFFPQEADAFMAGSTFTVLVP